MKGSKTYAEYLLNDKSLRKHSAMMPASAHAPVNMNMAEGGILLAQFRNPKLVERLIVQSKARVASMNTSIRPVVVREIKKEILSDEQLASS